MKDQLKKLLKKKTDLMLIKKSGKSVLSYRKHYFSQSGEDGILDYILSRIPEKTNWCVEYGAWNGIYLSNTFFFISSKDYRGVLIEADSAKYDDLLENMKSYNCTCINAYVKADGETRLDNVLKRTPVPREFDLLSIDVDGDDYQIWQSVQDYVPKVVIVEINIRDKPGIEHINQPGSPIVWGITGTSISSMTRLACQKGYCLVAQVGCNAVYVRREYLGLFYEREVSPEDVFTFEGHSLRELSLREIRSLGAMEIVKRVLKSGYQRLGFWDNK